MSERENIFRLKGIEGDKAASFRSRRPTEDVPIETSSPLDVDPTRELKKPRAKTRKSASFDAFTKYVEAARKPGD